MMRPLKKLISLDEAFKILGENTSAIIQVEEISLVRLANRVAAEDIRASMNVPPFRRAAMDGYAVIASSTFGASDRKPIYLTCIEKVHAGEIPTRTIKQHECIEIATGAICPDSADTVVPVEFTNKVDDKIEILKGFTPGDNVSPEGVDIKKGETVIHKGDIFTPARIGILAALNKTSAKVFRRPKVAIIPTGREIAPLGTQLNKGQVYDINSYTLRALIAQNGGIPVLFDIVPDEFTALENILLQALSTDLIVIVGGSSVGERDINIDVLSKHGTILFHGIQVKPGKPTLCGKIKDKLVINLPGYPTSCLTNAYLLLLPYLKKMASLPSEKQKTIRAKLSRKFVGQLGRHQILTVTVKNGLATPAFKESGAITSVAWADGYILIPYNVDLIEKGEEVEVILF